KNYADRRTKPLEFEVGDMVLLNVSSWKGVNLKKCLAEGDIVVLIDEIQLDGKSHVIEEPMEIVDREVKRLKQSRIPVVKVRWNSQRGPEFTWEREDQIKKKNKFVARDNRRPKTLLLDLDASGTIQFQLGGARRRMSWRDFILALGLHTGETLIRDPVLRLCHMVMAHSISGRSQAPKKKGDAGGVVYEAPVAPGGGDDDEDMPQDVPPPPRT
nr:hypothetical protein [Tanacetum cinerariifolium]